MTEFRRVFIDTSPFIYYLENSKIYKDKIKNFFAMCINENIQIVTSAITVEEYLTFPYKIDNQELIDNFKNFINYMNVEIIDVNFEIAERAAIIRGKYKDFKGMDALQIATAVISGCDMFFTNDKQLRQEKELPCMTMDDLK
jgi:predicted nucleic acid-binding protein